MTVIGVCPKRGAYTHSQGQHQLWNKPCVSVSLPLQNDIQAHPMLASAFTQGPPVGLDFPFSSGHSVSISSPFWGKKKSESPQSFPSLTSATGRRRTQACSHPLKDTDWPRTKPRGSAEPAAGREPGREERSWALAASWLAWPLTAPLLPRAAPWSLFNVPEPHTGSPPVPQALAPSACALYPPRQAPSSTYIHEWP